LGIRVHQGQGHRNHVIRIHGITGEPGNRDGGGDVGIVDRARLVCVHKLQVVELPQIPNG